MKSLVIFLLGAVIGAFAYSLYVSRETGAAPQEVEAPQPETRTLGERASDSTTGIKDRLAAKAKEWRLTPEEIKRELQRGGQIVREKAGAAGGKIADVRIVAVIKSKYVINRDLPAKDINVDCTGGKVTLTGDVASVELISKAVLLAMDTDGVVAVTSNLTITLER